MSDWLSRLEIIAAEGDSEDSDWIDPHRLSAAIDRLKGKLCSVVHRAQVQGAHHPTGMSACSWIATTCQVSRTSAADHLRVGAQLESLPRIAGALSSGEIGYQATSVICHLSEQLGEKRGLIDQDTWVGFAQRFSIKELRYLSHEARLHWDPDGFDKDNEEDYEQRYLHLSEMGRMFKLDGLLDHDAGAALKTAIESLSKQLGTDDDRSPKQRRADALSDLVDHALGQGTMPRRNRVRPHIAVHTTIEALRGEQAENVSTLECGGPISNKTLQRLACDGMLSRVVHAGSVVIDVGRATPNVTPAQWRARKARHKTCGWPGCDRPISWTSPHHIEFRCHGGLSTMSNLLPLCYHHHRLVHEGGWQILKAGDGFQFISPPHLWGGAAKRRWGERAA
jgi:Domain of unknown function (DUF222)